MVSRNIIQIFDDLDGSQLGKSEAQVIVFSIDRKYYRLDLSEENAALFRGSMAEWVQIAEVVQDPGADTGTTSRSHNAARRRRAKAVREWARANGHEISDRGQIPVAVQQAYNKMNPT